MIYGYYKPRDKWLFVGSCHAEDLDILKSQVRWYVSQLGLRCLFRWTDDNEYTCGKEPKNVWGKILDHPIETETETEK